MFNLADNKHRIITLDAVRGLAALAVVFTHIIGAIHLGHTFDEFTPLYIVRAGHEAVILFFVLSGYVLVYQYKDDKKLNYVEFILKRIFRIYIPYLIAIIFSVILYTAFYNQHIQNNPNWIGHNWQTSINLNLLLNHLILIGNFNTNSFDSVIWSLTHEMRISLIFPILLYVLKFDWRKVLLSCALVSFIIGITFIYNINPSQGYKNSYLYTLHYFSMFTIGGFIAFYQPQLCNWYNFNRKRFKYSFLIGALLFYNYAHLLTYFPEVFHKYRLLNFNVVFEDWLVAIASSYIIVAAIVINSKKSFLKSYIPLNLGKISYSLYLLHVPIMLAVYSQLYYLNIYLVMVISLTLSILIAVIFNKYIEQNAAKYGKIVAHFAK